MIIISIVSSALPFITATWNYHWLAMLKYRDCIQSFTTTRIALFASFILALGIRLLYLAYHGPAPIFEDALQYLGIAKNLVEHSAFSISHSEPFIPTIRRPLTYPLFLAILHILHIRTPIGILITHALLDSICCLLIFHLASWVAPR